MANSPIRDGRLGVRVYFCGQAGNQFFHYCLGKVLAAKRGLEFTPPPEFMDWKNDPVKWSGEPLFVMRPTDGETYPEGNCLQFGGKWWYDFDSLPAGRGLHICYGHWCRYELYRDWKRQIREEWLPIPAHRYVTTDPEAVYIHVRLTDFKVDPETAKSQGSVTPISAFAACLKTLSDYKRLVIVTDDPKDPFHQEFRLLGLPFEISGLSWDEDFLLLASCRQMVMSASTYSWWAGFLGRCEKIVCPILPNTMWSASRMPGASRDNIDLYVDDEPERWLFLDVPADQ